MLSRRLRGLLGTTLLGCIPWTALGVVTGFVLLFDLIPGVEVFLSRPVPGGLPVACALAGALVGAINGLTFGALLLASERGKSLDDIRGWRFAGLGALATAATLGLLFQSPIVGAAGGIVGAGAAAGALWLARRAGRQQADAFGMTTP
jgi:hypothetical protein